MELLVTVELAGFRMTWVSLQMVILTVHQRERTLFHTGGGFHGGVTDVSAASQTFLFCFCTCSQVSLGSMLIFSHRSSGAGGSRCLSEDQLRHRVDKFRKSYWDRLNVSRNLPQWNTMTCAQIARELRGELSNRSVSPWRYRYVTRAPLRGPRGDKYALRYHERAEIATVRHNRGGGSTHNLY